MPEDAIPQAVDFDSAAGRQAAGLGDAMPLRAEKPGESISLSRQEENLAVVQSATVAVVESVSNLPPGTVQAPVRPTSVAQVKAACGWLVHEIDEATVGEQNEAVERDQMKRLRALHHLHAADDILHSLSKAGSMGGGHAG